MADENTFPVYKRGHAGVFGQATLAQVIASNGVLSQTPHATAQETTGGVSGGADGGGGAGANPPGAAPPITQGADGSAPVIEGTVVPEGGAPAGDGASGEGLAGEGGADPAKVKKAKGA